MSDETVTSAPREALSRLSFTDEEYQVLACVGRAAQVADVIARCGLSPSKATATILALRAKGALRGADPTPTTVSASPVSAPQSATFQFDTLRDVPDRSPRPSTPERDSEPPPKPAEQTSAAPTPSADPVNGPAEPKDPDEIRAEERRARLARHPYLSRVKKRHGPV
ncbi:MAG TPA: hypothetical protein VEY30_01040 [Myxococcaceae bacterium]|nr:hypothetical protein [Myxococcaceae bacterium]